jgi:hypothetical protein
MDRSRNVPKVSNFIVSGTSVEVYNAPRGEREIPVTLWNRGKQNLTISFQGGGAGLATDWPLPSGAICAVNPENEIWAICPTGSSTLFVGTGIDMVVNGLSSIEGLSPSAMVQMVALAHTQKELLAQLLLQLKRLVAYSAEGFNTSFTDMDVQNMP